MKTITRMIRYILISLLTMAIFFIALFVCCVSLENALPLCLNFFHFFTPAPAANLEFTVVVSILTALYTAGSFMHKALYKVGDSWGK